MRLVTEELPEIDNVTHAEIEEVLGEDVFGKFAVLEASDGAFMQAGCVWEPGPESEQFLQQTGSDPFRLEYRDARTGKLFAAEGNLTLDQVTRAFTEYLNGETEWLRRFAWREVDVD